MTSKSIGTWSDTPKLLLIAGIASFICLALASAADTGAKKVPGVTGDARVDQLLSKMTLQEKIDMIRGGVEGPSTYQGQAGYISGVPRLGIPSLRFADGPPGVLTRHPSQAETATMGVAATFSREDAYENGVVIGREARSLGIDVSLQPFINLDRDITFARGYNTFGEDPLLTGAMGAAEIRGIQSQDVMAMAKHYVAYDSNSFDIVVGQQALHEMYLAPFADAVHAGVSSIMCSYNKVNGDYACGNRNTLEKILKGELAFRGFVTSDWGAMHSVTFLSDGLDMEMPGELYPGSPFAMLMHTYLDLHPAVRKAPAKLNTAAVAGLLGGTLPEEPPAPPINLSGIMAYRDPLTLSDALQKGAVTEAEITRAAGRVLYEMDKFGYLDGKEKHSITAHDTEANARIIQKTAEDSAVLLKNEGHALPLNDSDLRSVALIGPGAGQVDAIGTFGERSGGLIARQVGPLQALKDDTAHDRTVHIMYAVDDDMTGAPVPAALLSHDGKPGLIRTGADGKTQIDPQINFTLSNQRALAANGSWTWKGNLSVPSTGSYWIYLQALGDRAALFVDGKRVAGTGAMAGTVHGDTQQATQDNPFPTTDGLDNVRRAVQLTAGAHALMVTISGDTSNNPEQVRLNWVTPEQRKTNHEAAIATAKAAKTAVVFAWSRGKPDFALPGDQDKLIEDVAAVNPNTIVVLNVSQPISMPWLDKVKAVLLMWWPGDEGGWATANVLLGRVNPAGRLPFTWGKRLEDYPATDPEHPERSAQGVDGKTTYSEGILVGYRWFDAQRLAPLFPFGYGLSYTKFQYSAMKVVHASDGGLNVNFTIKNTGAVAGDEVPQVYIGPPANPPAGAQFAVRSLAAFTRIDLLPGQSKTIALHVAPRSLQYWSRTAGQWQRARGSREIFTGSSSRDLLLKETVGGF